MLENSAHFNARFGVALNENFIYELDAAIMDGHGMRAGAIAAAQGIRNPILSARAVMESNDAVLLACPAADVFAKQAGL